ncbi:Predicted ATP-dependent endonuclease of the OLD family, contains P-loop ATPase and TOPRIM domains [Bacteroides luti]|uniref:Predicted ATP-dependent endonuclease of the OLD family, contains P-loop ATPase and TOPRIM domains n=1 Tax=Bacteroides luti TaxID=1297750 RepID=A0A1M5GYL2_9BACE|nr:TOPRIM nucleotidyl transferase/hydrolase domain-containing protein [Bacteroides luti]SHG08809.1 Predicted ATP-dependent endonuclease of the OLD family, contains P-loop ATPase and TOPRIM domains [Bacteroides luti]
MGKIIKKIRIINFKRFKELELPFNDIFNVFVGDNESGKSTILTAINLVLSASLNKIDTLGLDSLLNIEAVKEFMTTDKKVENLPVMCIELYLNDQDNIDLNGKNNLDKIECDGLKLVCEPRSDLGAEINEVLRQDNPVFPYEYYAIRFRTFADMPLNNYKKYLSHMLIDNSSVSGEYAMREYTKDIFKNNTVNIERSGYQNKYRLYKNAFTNNVLSKVNGRLNKYSFRLKHNSKYNLETDITICEEDINIEDKGKGKQCFVKTEFALNNNANLDIILIEEPENHLSHINMKKLVSLIANTGDRQLFVTTHSNMISSRLDLRNLVLMNSNGNLPTKLKDLDENTAKFFMKAPDNKILEFILSSKIILVEGDAEYILMESFFKHVTQNSLEESNVHVIAVGGIRFKRYLDLAKKLQIKTAVITDNDKKYQENCVDNYNDYSQDGLIKVFSDSDNERYTFEVCIYKDNTSICEMIFGPRRKVLSVQEYMLKNKAESAFNLLSENSEGFIIPNYIKEAIEWINE